MTDELTVRITERAQQVLQNQATQLRACQSVWVHSEDHLDPLLKMAETLTRCLGQVFSNGFGPTTISGEDELSLLVSSGITMGMIFHFKERPDFATAEDRRALSWAEAPYMGLYCLHDVAGIGPCRQPIIKGEHGDHAEHAPEPYALPILGDWSLHS